MAEGVYHAVGTGALAVIGNGAVIVNDDDVVIVDDHVSPAAAWVLLEEVKRLTPKPVRYVINTHFHFDHAHGNQIFGAGVDIIGHEFTREMLTGGKSLQMPLYKSYVDADAGPGRDAPRPSGGREGSGGARQAADAALRRPRTTSPRRRSCAPCRPTSRCARR